MKLFQNLMKRYHPKENSKQLIKLIFKSMEIFPMLELISHFTCYTKYYRC